MRAVDLDLHGALVIRVHPAAPTDVTVVERQLGGAVRRSPGRRPDLVLRFVDDPDLRPLHVLGDDEYGTSPDEFLVLRGKHKQPVVLTLPFDRLGEPGTELRCGTGAAAVPLLVPIVNLLLLARGVLPLHASAFVHEGRAVLVTGWSKGGKTEALLSFLARGSRYVGDEWVHLRPGRPPTASGLVEPVRVWDWQLESARLPSGALSRRRRAGLATGRAAVRALEHVGTSDGGGLGRSSRRALHLVRDQLRVDVPVDRLTDLTQLATDVPISQVHLVLTARCAGVEVAPTTGDDVAARAWASLQYERRPLRDAYDAFRFAFPDRRSTLVETAPRWERELLAETVAVLPAYVVTHPRPFDLGDLYDAVAPVITGEVPA